MKVVVFYEVVFYNNLWLCVFKEQVNKGDKQRVCKRGSKREGDGFRENYCYSCHGDSSTFFLRDLSVFVCVFLCVKILIISGPLWDQFNITKGSHYALRNVVTSISDITRSLTQLTVGCTIVTCVLPQSPTRWRCQFLKGVVVMW